MINPVLKPQIPMFSKYGLFKGGLKTDFEKKAAIVLKKNTLGRKKMSRNYFRSDNDDYETIISDLGIEKHIFPDGTEHYEDPGWGYVYTKEDEYSVTCPNVSGRLFSRNPGN